MAETEVATPEAPDAAPSAESTPAPDAPVTTDAPASADAAAPQGPTDAPAEVAVEAEVPPAPEAAKEPELDPMEQAFLEAKAEQEGKEGPATEPPSEPSTPDASLPPESSEAAPEPTAPAAPTEDSQSLRSPDLSRIDTLLSQGRESELTDAQRGTLNRIRETAKSQVVAETAQENEFRTIYLEGEKMRVEDPEGYAAFTHGAKGAEWITFHRSFEDKHPEVSLEHPQFGTDASAGPDLTRVQQDARSEVFRDQNSVLAQVAEGQGISKERVAEIETETGGGHAMIPTIVAEAIKAGIEKQLPEVKEQERTAAEKEASLKAVSAAKVPVTMPASTNGAPGKEEATSNDIGDSWLEAKEEMEKAGLL